MNYLPEWAVYLLVIGAPAFAFALSISWWHDRKRRRWQRDAKARAAFLERAADQQVRG